MSDPVRYPAPSLMLVLLVVLRPQCVAQTQRTHATLTIQINGLIWPGHYGVYQTWENTIDQRNEMLVYDMIDGFSQCSSSQGRG